MYSRYGGMYGGYGGMGMYGMGGLGMGMGMYGMGGGGGALSNSVGQMFQMTQMMELNTMFLDQMQEQFGQISYRLGSLGEWLLGLNKHFRKNEFEKQIEDAYYSKEGRGGEVGVELGESQKLMLQNGQPALVASKYNQLRLKSFASAAEREESLARVRRRIRMVLVLMLLFFAYTWRKYVRGQKLAKQAHRIWAATRGVG